MRTSYLIQRNIKMFFKDKGFVLTSLITPLILILLYVTFLKNVYVDSFNSALEQTGITISENYINGFVYGWLFSSLLAVSGVTVSFCSNLLMVQDKVTGAIRDLEIAPVKRTKIAVAYYVASMSVSMVIVLIEAIVGFLIIAGTGWFLSVGDVLKILLGVFLLVNFGTALSSIIHHFLTTQGQMSAVGTIVSSVYGFICGAYMPISQFGSGLQKILSLLPGTYATVFIRDGYERGVLNKLVSECNFPQEVVDNMASTFDVSISFFGHNVPSWACGLILGLATLLCLGIYILLNVKKNKKLSSKKMKNAM